MALVFANRVKVATSTTGTGTVTLGAAETAFQTFADGGISDADAVVYLIEDGNAWEIGVGTYTASGTTLTRASVRESTNSDAALNLTGSATVSIVAASLDVAPAKDDQTFNSSGTWNKPVGNYRFAIINVWGGGGSGAKFDNTNAGGGGGGGFYETTMVPFADLGTTETVTIGAGGTSVTAADTRGNDGGSSSFGSLLTAIGGAGGGRQIGRSGKLDAATLNTGGGFDPNGRGPGAGNNSATIQPGQGVGHIAGGGGFGGTTTDAGNAGADAVFGGGGGGGGAMDSSPGPGAGGTSIHGGNGGAGAFDTNNATAGTQPGGGGGGSEDGNSGAGGAGRVRVICV